VLLVAALVAVVFASCGASREATSGTPAAWSVGPAPLVTIGRVQAPFDVDDLRRVREVPGTDSIPAFSELLKDDAGHLWLKRYDARTDSHWVRRKRTGGAWLVVGTDGRVIARTMVPDGFRLMAVRGERLAGVAVDRLGVERVQVYALDRD